jgi:hypothetical protein
LQGEAKNERKKEGERESGRERERGGGSAVGV